MVPAGGHLSSDARRRIQSAGGHAIAATHTTWFVVRLKRHGSWSRHAIRRARRRRQSSDRVVTWPMLRLTADGRGARAFPAGRSFG